MPGTPAPVVLVGETMMVFNGPMDAAIRLHSAITATFAGAESNVAIGLARLGHAARFLSAFGDDLFGQIVLRALRGEGIDVSRVQVGSTHPTGVMFKSRRAGAEPQVLYYRCGSAFSHCDAASFGPDAWSDAAVLFVTGITPALSPGCREMTQRLLEGASQHRLPAFFDVNHRRKLWADDDARSVILSLLPLIDTVLLGVGEGQLLAGQSEPRAIADALLNRGSRRVIVKNGERGSHAFTASGEDFAPALPIEPLDPIGAGDAFAAGFLSGHLDGLAPEQCLQRGNALGAMCCLTQGDWEGLPDRAELSDFLARRTEAAR